ncbi:2-(1,2-epoxy-1,2-dihydrophenyl)acetyl-CoA isomerase PaaG [Castellaniella sp.]|uniref:2-(1,2-epoxy-1,2-dihydrophenyl)acetyl-CoA isomerase PaaG n=1 Tax=Castellaniella sp. TaxID=1955812 RepID=UPI003C770429
MTYQHIQFSIQNGVARIMLARPNKLNSFTEDMHLELRDALTQVQSSIDARALVITGAGRGFCAGQDLGDRGMQIAVGQAPDLGATVEKFYKPLILSLQNLRVPTLAAVNGIAAGAGASLALACDLVVASESAYFLQAFSKVGLIPDTGGTWLLPQRIGMARAMGLALLAQKLPAQQAAEWGLIWACVPDAAFQDEINRLAGLLAQAPTQALVRTRQAMQAAASHTLEQQLSMEAGFMRELGWRHDYAEGVAAFLEKRSPCFTGE